MFERFKVRLGYDKNYMRKYFLYVWHCACSLSQEKNIDKSVAERHSEKLN